MVALDLQTISKPEGAYFVCHFHFLKSLARARSGLSDWLLQLQVWSSVAVHTATTGMSCVEALPLCAAGTGTSMRCGSAAGERRARGHKRLLQASQDRLCPTCKPPYQRYFHGAFESGLQCTLSHHI